MEADQGVAVAAFVVEGEREGQRCPAVALGHHHRARCEHGGEGVRQRPSEALEPLLAGGGRVVTESDRRAPLEFAIPLIHERRYGDTLIRIHTNGT
jgi:hypothetical protein